jgi:glycosyltransferase involved in cell wall biosynthesis
MSKKTRIAIAWNGLPLYAARLIKEGIQRIQEPVSIIASQPNVPILGMEEFLEQKITWIDSNEKTTWDTLNLDIPDIFFHTGWAYPAFNSLGREVRKKGGSVVSMVDNCWQNSPRQWIGALVFRLVYRRWFDAVWVPGQSAYQLCRFLGMPQERIYQGMYGADSSLFFPGTQLYQRKKQFIFVGQFIQRKGVDILVEAFKKFKLEFPDWNLKVFGCGPLNHLFQNQPGIISHGFQQPTKIAAEMCESRFLILASREEHWGLVVHEATLAGCGVIASKDVGSVADLLFPPLNGFIVSNHSSDALYNVMKQSALLTNFQLENIQTKSLELSSLFGPETWANEFLNIISNLKEWN